MKIAKIDLSKNPEIHRIWAELEKKFNAEVFRLRKIAEEREQKARARYGDPVVYFNAGVAQ